jgi:hypothetical protein
MGAGAAGLAVRVTADGVSVAGGSCGRVVKQTELEVAADRLVEGATSWTAAYRAWEQAVDGRDRAAARMQRRVTETTGGLSVTRFEAVCHRRSVRSVAEAEQKASAIRARAAVEAAVAERDRTVAAADAAVMAARIALAEASKRILGYGTAGTRMVGRSRAELGRLAMLPARTPLS